MRSTGPGGHDGAGKAHPPPQIAEGLVRTFTDADADTGAVTPRRRAMTFLEALSRGDDPRTAG
jgi:hypothetical protein